MSEQQQDTEQQEQQEAYSPAQMALQEALENLTVGEVAAIERHFGRTLDGGKLSGTDLTVAAVWATERRRLLGQPDRPDWRDLDDWTMKQLNAYFEPEAIEVDPSDPETDQGKGDSLVG